MFILIVSQRDISSSLLRRIISIFSLLCAFFAFLGGLKIFPKFCSQLRNFVLKPSCGTFSPLIWKSIFYVIWYLCPSGLRFPSSVNLHQEVSVKDTWRVTWFECLFLNSWRAANISSSQVKSYFRYPNTHLLWVIFLSYSSDYHLTLYFFVRWVPVPLVLELEQAAFHKDHCRADELHRGCCTSETFAGSEVWRLFGSL